MEREQIDRYVNAELARRDRRPQRGLRRALEEYFLWCDRVGVGVDSDELSDVALIVRFVGEVADPRISTGRTWRWLLLDHFETTRPSMLNGETRLVSCGMPPSTSTAYTPSEEHLLVTAAPTLRQPAFRRSLMALLICCLGAGLTRDRAALVAPSDLLFDDSAGHWTLSVAGGIDLPVRALLDPLAQQLVALDPHESGLLVGGGTAAIRHRPAVAGIRVDTRRLRATYIVRLIEGGVPVAVILELTGLRSIAALQHYYPQAVRPDFWPFVDGVVHS